MGSADGAITYTPCLQKKREQQYFVHDSNKIFKYIVLVFGKQHHGCIMYRKTIVTVQRMFTSPNIITFLPLLVLLYTSLYPAK